MEDISGIIVGISFLFMCMKFVSGFAGWAQRAMKTTNWVGVPLTWERLAKNRQLNRTVRGDGYQGTYRGRDVRILVQHSTTNVIAWSSQTVQSTVLQLSLDHVELDFVTGRFTRIPGWNGMYRIKIYGADSLSESLISGTRMLELLLACKMPFFSSAQLLKGQGQKTLSLRLPGSQDNDIALRGLMDALCEIADALESYQIGKKRVNRSIHKNFRPLNLDQPAPPLPAPEPPRPAGIAAWYPLAAALGMNYQPFAGRMVGAWGGRGAALGAGTLTESTFLSAQLTQSTRLLVEMADAESLRLGLAIRRVEEADRSLPAAVAYAFLPGCDPDLNTLAALAAPDLPDLLLPQLPGDLFPAVLMSHPSGALALTVPGLITDPDFAAALLDRLTAVVMALESLKVEEQVVVEASL